MTRIQMLLIASPFLILVGAGTGLYIRKRKPEWQHSATMFRWGFLCGIVLIWVSMMLLSRMDFGTN